jgi:hypothetical protein
MSFESRLRRLEELAAHTEAAGRGEIERAMHAVTGLNTAFKLHHVMLGGVDPEQRKAALATVLEIAERGDFDGANRAAHEFSAELYDAMRKRAAEATGNPHISIAEFMGVSAKEFARP